MDILNPYWKYKDDDLTTWKYITCKVNSIDKIPTRIQWYLNPDFSYKHLDPNYNKEVCHGSAIDRIKYRSNRA